MSDRLIPRDFIKDQAPEKLTGVGIILSSYFDHLAERFFFIKNFNSNSCAGWWETVAFLLKTFNELPVPSTNRPQLIKNNETTNQIWGFWKEHIWMPILIAVCIFVIWQPLRNGPSFFLRVGGGGVRCRVIFWGMNFSHV